jgi:hypothetical protein
LAEAPGARLAALKTTVPAAGRFTTTVMFERVSSPVFITVPLNVRVPPGATGVAGQVFVM